MLANAHCYSSLCDARSAAVAYLRAHADTLAGDARTLLLQTVRLYAELSERVLGARPAVEIAPFPWMLVQGQAWSAAQRRAQAAVLERALALEMRAVDTIADALRRAGE
jgi:hypothetical protein